MPCRGHRKLYCYMGHPLYGQNLRIYITSAGYIEHVCKQCELDRHKRQYHQKKRGGNHEKAL
jgi:hypothetical protein